MKIITQRELIRDVAVRWREAYEPFKNDQPLKYTLDKTKRQIAEELDALDKEKATAQDVAAIIGNSSWTRLECHECGRDVETVVRVGEAPDYESATACLCRSCLLAATELKAYGE